MRFSHRNDRDNRQKETMKGDIIGYPKEEAFIW